MGTILRTIILFAGVTTTCTKYVYWSIHVTTLLYYYFFYLGRPTRVLVEIARGFAINKLR